MIAGGGETGFHLARTLESERFKVTLMDSLERSQFLAKDLSQTSVIHGDATRREVLQEERVGTADAFIACSGNDENNILAGVEARDLGAETIMAVVGRPDYAQVVVGKLGIDVAVSEREVMARQVLSFLQEGNVLRRQRLSGGEVELVEPDVDQAAPAIGIELRDLKIPGHCLLVALICHEFIRVPTAQDQLHAGDRLILLVQNHDADAVIAFLAG